MTNEEKIHEIINNQPFAGGNDNYRLMIEWGARQMAEWKDQQFKRCLENKLKKNLKDWNYYSGYKQLYELFRHRNNMIEEIINEFLNIDDGEETETNP